jgi:hypothetical protein
MTPPPWLAALSPAARECALVTLAGMGRPDLIVPLQAPADPTADDDYHEALRDIREQTPRRTLRPTDEVRTDP